MNEIPHFKIKKNLQKSLQTGKYFSDDVTEEVLKDISLRLYNTELFTFEYLENEYKDQNIDKGYNKGRMIYAFFKGTVTHISVSESKIKGRNSSVQSVPTVYSRGYKQNRKLIYYFLPEVEGKIDTPYHIFTYRLMKTIGFSFINDEEVLHKTITPFNSISEIKAEREQMKKKNKSNNSSYIHITKDEVEIYAKTYGANKYDSAMICYAVAHLTNRQISVYQITDKDMKVLPEAVLDVLATYKNIEVMVLNTKFEKRALTNNNVEKSYRSPKFRYNLYEKFGSCKCAMCDCQIDEVIEAAHIWPVASIKNSNLPEEEKERHSIAGDNGIWLCANHHKLFDKNFIVFNDKNGSFVNSSILNEKDQLYINSITTEAIILPNYINDKVIDYIKKRNENIKII